MIFWNPSLSSIKTYFKIIGKKLSPPKWVAKITLQNSVTDCDMLEWSTDSVWFNKPFGSPSNAIQTFLG